MEYANIYHWDKAYEKRNKIYDKISYLRNTIIPNRNIILEVFAINTPLIIIIT